MERDRERANIKYYSVHWSFCFLAYTVMETPVTLLLTLLYAACVKLPSSSCSHYEGNRECKWTGEFIVLIYDRVFSAGDENSRAADVCGNHKASSPDY